MSTMMMTKKHDDDAGADDDKYCYCDETTTTSASTDLEDSTNDLDGSDGSTCSSNNVDSDAATLQKMITTTRSSTLETDDGPFRELDDSKKLVKEISVTSGAGTVNRIAQRGDIITLDLNLQAMDGFVPDSLMDRHGQVSFVLGGGHYLPGLHELCYQQQQSIMPPPISIQKGAQVANAVVDAGWGSRQASLVFRVGRRQLKRLLLRRNNNDQDTTPELTTTAASNEPSSFACGQTIEIDKTPVVVTKIIRSVVDDDSTTRDSDDDVIVLDANPPMAGASYSCSFTVLDVEAPPTLDRMNNFFDDHQRVVVVGDDDDSTDTAIPDAEISSPYRVATFALGCFWGAELAFMRVPGVVGTQVGYTKPLVVSDDEEDDGSNDDDDGEVTYQLVGSGQSRHREAVRVIYHPSKVSYRELLKVARQRLVDTKSQHQRPLQQHPSTTTPTVDDEAENDWLYQNDDSDDDDGTSNPLQYRLGMYAHTPDQLCEAQDFFANANNSPAGSNVEVAKVGVFHVAEEYHQQYLYKGGQSARKGAKEPIRCFG